MVSALTCLLAELRNGREANSLSAHRVALNVSEESKPQILKSICHSLAFLPPLLV